MVNPFGRNPEKDFAQRVLERTFPGTGVSLNGVPASEARSFSVRSEILVLSSAAVREGLFQDVSTRIFT